MPKEITNYMVLSRKSTRDLSKAVEMAITAGFQPHGSMAVERVIVDSVQKGVQAAHTLYYQPMVKITGFH